MSSLRFGDFFVFCNDVTIMKTFYTDVLGFKPSYFIDNENFGHLSYVIDSFINLVFMRAETNIEYKDRWAKGPVFADGTSYDNSWTIRCDDFKEYKKRVIAIQSAGVKTYSEKPLWVGNYWSFMIKDPMGNSIDFYHEPKDEPNSTLW